LVSSPQLLQILLMNLSEILGRGDNQNDYFDFDDLKPQTNTKMFVILFVLIAQPIYLLCTKLYM